MSALAQSMLSRTAGRVWSRLLEATDIAAAAIPILCYHSISDEPHAINPARFAAQMRWLRRRGYRGVGLEQVVHPTPPCGGDRRVVITFDDGLADLEANALPVLVECGLRAIIFFSPALAGMTAWYSPRTRAMVTSPEEGAKRLDFMSWEQADRMAAAGMSFQSHGWSHARLSALDYGELVDELSRSRRVLEEHFGTPVRFLSYPFGDFDAPTQQAAAGLGYMGAASTRPGFSGPGCDRYALRRVAPNPTDDLCAFAFKLSPAAGWYYRRTRPPEDGG
ncbi:MAG TPA: polysaccharide deacetylase family protein [Armatimonadota bacterium]|nr:polysaccharide deacetylase family protein [Armatimonadota bacterium]